VKILVAPQAFKGSLDAIHVAQAIARGIRDVFPDAELTILPVADGGEGTVRAMVQASGGHTITSRVMGPLERPVNATWGVLGDGVTGVIEMAAASGLPLIRREERNPLRATSFGTGELIRHALDNNLKRLIIGIGGSATNDGGVGMAQALGAHFLDSEGNEILLGGGNLKHLRKIEVSELDPRLESLDIEVACDVNNPLCGPTGATMVYGPQKGTDAQTARELDDALADYARLLIRDVGKDVAEIPGAGAAGGMGAGLLAFTHARLRPGVEIVFHAIDLDRHVKESDLVFTGEGRMDQQDIYGKAPMAVAQRAAVQGVPSIAVVGSTGRDYHIVFEHGLDAVIGTVNRPMPMDRAVAEGPRLIAEAAMRACRLLTVGMKLEARKS
jgi:glycerate kinase